MAKPGKSSSLADLPLLIGRPALPPYVRSLLRAARRRIDRFQQERSIPAFVPSDFPAVYAALWSLLRADLATGDLFCEWGSGFGVVTCLAALLGFDAHGIEIEEELVEAAQQLADDFDLSAEFVQGSFIPPGGSRHARRLGDFSWLTTEEGRAHEELGIPLEDFSVIFAYPWPDEEQAVVDVFTEFAGTGAILVTYHGMDGVRFRQKN